MVMMGIKSEFHAHFSREAEKLGIADRILLLPRISETQKFYVYKNAEVAFLTSWDEGFGIPALEAMIARLPLVCSDRGSLREIAGSAALFFSPNWEAKRIAAVLARALQSEQDREHLVAAGKLEIERFTKERVERDARNFWKIALSL